MDAERQLVGSGSLGGRGSSAAHERWLPLSGLFAGVAVTAGLVLSNKDLLVRPAMHNIGPPVLLLLHRLVTWAFYRLTYCGRAFPPRKFSLSLLFVGATLSNGSIAASLLTLQSASVAFQQLTRLMGLPMSAVFDYVLYRKHRGGLEYFSLLLLSYGVFTASTGDATATPLAFMYASIGVLCALGSTAVTGYILKSTGMPITDLVVIGLPYDIVMSALLLLVVNAYNGKRTGTLQPAFEVAEGCLDLALLLRLFVNASLAITAVYLSVWTQGKCSNMMYAVLGQAKSIACIVLSTACLHMEISTHLVLGMAIVFLVAFFLALGELEPIDVKSSRSRWLIIALLSSVLSIIALDVLITAIPVG